VEKYERRALPGLSVSDGQPRDPRIAQLSRCHWSFPNAERSAANASADSVQVFTDVRPERAHEELGVIDVKSSPLALKSDCGQLVLEARQRAAQMGADAIIVTRRPVEHTTTTGNITPRKKNKGGTYTESTSTSETARISVVAIAWKNAP
jgi:hypothetical protein